MMNLVIRPAQVSDCPRLLELIYELAQYEKAADQVEVTLDHFVASGFGDNPVWWANVAEVDGEISGFALYYIRYSTWKGQRLYLEDILVTRTYRRKGIGKLLFDSVIEDARQRGMNGIVWQVLDWNTPAISFYEKYSPVFNQDWITCTLEKKEYMEYFG